MYESSSNNSSLCSMVSYEFLLFVEHVFILFYLPFFFFFNSEDFFADVKKPEKAAEVEQSDSSDSIPCSQNRPQRQLKKEQEKGVDKEVVMETGDPFTVDVSIGKTLMQVLTVPAVCGFQC